MSACALFTRVNLSPAVIVRPNSIKARILLDWVTAFLQDEVGIPVQTLFPFFRHAHQTTIKFPILLVTVVWPSRETKIKRSSAEWGAFWVVSEAAVIWRIYRLHRRFRCTRQGRNIGNWSVWDPSCKYPHFDKDWACRERLRGKNSSWIN